MRRLFTIALLFICAQLFVTCVEPFDPPEIASPERILVIEGTLDAPDGKAEVIISRISPINSPTSDSLNFRISNAIVEVLVNGNTYSLPETDPGVYTSLIPVADGDMAQLMVQTEGEIYQSDEVQIKPVPDIDSVTFSADEFGVTIEVTTHDPSNNTKYYQWSFEETAEYTTQYGSSYYYDGMEVYQRVNEQLLTCWKSLTSSNILVATTDGLSEDLVYKFPIASIKDDSWKKEITYSVLVSQYSISEETFEFLREMEDNTENVGSLFDPQPGRIFGNLTSLSNSQEYVIGQFSARSETQKRFFLNSNELPDYPRSPPLCSFSDLDTVFIEDLYQETRPRVLIGALTTPMGTIYGYLFSTPVCMDCRLIRGGTNIKPDYWQ